MQVQNQSLVKPDIQHADHLATENCSRRRTVLLHDTEELDDDFRARSDETLALASLFGVVDALESVVQDGGSNHVGDMVR
jgi:hypothetical protein